MTLNLNYFFDKHGPWEERKKLISEVIKKANPDVVAFQAVAKDPDQGSIDNQAKQLCNLISSYKYCVFRAADRKDGDKEEGNGFISKLPFSEVKHIKLTRLETEDPFQRIVLRVAIQSNGEKLYLFNGHFSWVEEQARQNIKETLKFVKEVSGKAALMGDMNTPPESHLWKPLKEEGWEDSWAKGKGTESGYTYESDKPFTRIDYIWANPALKQNLKNIVVVNYEKGSNVRLSDHMGVVAEFA